jgi:hypothetical protein
MSLTITKHPAGGMAGRLMTEHVIMHACTTKAKLFDCTDKQAEAVRGLLEGAHSSPGCIAGELVEVGDDDEGNPRLVVSATREAIKAGVVNMLFKPVLVMSPADIPKEEGSSVFAEIAAERVRQNAQWGGPEHDDAHGPIDWLQCIDYQHSRATVSDYRERMVKIAALAVAAIESHDRVMARGDKTGQNAGEAFP